MDFQSYVDAVRPCAEFSKLIINQNLSEQKSLAEVVALVEKQGGEVITINIINSLEPNRRIVEIYLAGENVNEIAVALAEEQLWEVEGIGRSHRFSKGSERE